MFNITCKSCLKNTTPAPATPKTPATPSPSPSTNGTWCVPKSVVSNAQLQANLDYACGQGIDCRPVQPGGACFEPNTVASHAAYAMNLFYQNSARNPWNCDFSQTATLTSKNPSKSSQTPMPLQIVHRQPLCPYLKLDYFLLLKAYYIIIIYLVIVYLFI